MCPLQYTFAPSIKNKRDKNDFIVCTLPPLSFPGISPPSTPLSRNFPNGWFKLLTLSLRASSWSDFLKVRFVHGRPSARGTNFQFN